MTSWKLKKGLWKPGLMVCTCLICSALGVTVYAADKPPSCPEQLAQAAQHANNLTGDRNNKEYSLAKLQVELQQWKQQAAMLQKQLDDLKKPAEPDKKE